MMVPLVRQSFQEFGVPAESLLVAPGPGFGFGSLASLLPSEDEDRGFFGGPW